MIGTILAKSISSVPSLDVGDIGGVLSARTKTFLWGGDVTIADPTDLASESLANGALTNGTSWTQTGDMALTGNAAVYTHSAGSGTLNQASGTLAIAGLAKAWYRFVYTTTAVTSGCTATITTAFADATITLPLAAGTHTIYFKSAASPGNFVISVTSTAGGFTIDTLSLKQIIGGDLLVEGSIKAANGSATAPSIGFESTANAGFYIVDGSTIGLVVGASNWIIVDAAAQQVKVNGAGIIGMGAGSPINAIDTGLSRNAAGVWELNNGTAGTFRDLKLRDIFVNNQIITAGSGTGVTVNSIGNVNRQVYKATITYAALSAAALTADKVIATLPAKTKLVGIIADTTATYTGGAVTAATIIVGKTTGGNEYIVSHDVFTAAITKGLADADLGTSINRANAVQGGDTPSWTATTDISVRLTTVTGNTNVLTQGSTTYYLITERF